MNDARKAQAPVTASLSRPHTLFHEAVLGRTVKRLAFRAHCFASAGVPLALLHEAHLGSAVKRLAVRAHCLAVAGLRRCRTDREAGNQHRYNNTLGNLQPVFATMLEKAVAICEARFGDIYRWDGDALRLVANHNTPPAFAEERKRTHYLRPVPGPPGTSMSGAMLATKSVVHVADLAAERGYIERSNPTYAAAVELGGVRTILMVPMLKENELIGAFILCRQDARLLNELRQSLERQTATSEVLQVISSSPGDLQPVFAAMLENAARICDANFGNIFRWDGQALRLIATHNTPPAFAEARRRLPLQPNRVNPIGHMLATQKTVHIADLAADARYTEQHDPDVVIAVELGAFGHLWLSRC